MSEKGLKPMLLLENPTIPAWVWDWQHDPIGNRKFVRPEGLRVSRRERNVSNYICHFNDITVYVAPLPYGASYVIAEEAFQEVLFTTFDPDIFVRAETTPVKGDPAKIDLRLTWEFKVTVRAIQATKLIYDAQNSGAGS
jgi:hypothetical protein